MLANIVRLLSFTGRYVRVRLFPLVGLAVLAASPAAAQSSATIEGTVVAKPGNAPVADAVVFLDGRFSPAVTDHDGRFRLTNVPFGSGRSWCSAPGSLSCGTRSWWARNDR